MLTLTFGSWVYRITANAAYERLRRRHHERHEVSWEAFAPSFDELGHHAAPITDWSARVDDPAAQNELRAELTRAIDQLPPDSRTVVVMRDVDGMSNADVAVALRMSVAAVKARLHRARLFLRERLSRFWATQPGAEGTRVEPTGRARCHRGEGRDRCVADPPAGDCHSAQVDATGHRRGRPEEAEGTLPPFSMTAAASLAEARER